jgi:Zn-dependent protease
MFGNLDTLFTHPEIFVIWILCVVISLTIHEFGHALAGYWEGDSTAQEMGRLTINPLAHIDWIGFLLLIFVGFGWGKPVPFNPYNLKHKRWGPALVSIAGPLSNLIVLIIAGVVLKLLAVYSNLSAENLLVIFLLYLMQINLVLMIFNLIPIPPLDGSKILYSFFSMKHKNIIIFLETRGFWILLILLLFGGSLLGSIFNFFFNLVLYLLNI